MGQHQNCVLKVCIHVADMSRSDVRAGIFPLEDLEDKHDLL